MNLGRLWPAVREADGHVWVYAREAGDPWRRRLQRLAPDGSPAATGTLESDLGRSRARVLGFDNHGRILAAVLETVGGSTRMRLARFHAASGARFATLAPSFAGAFGEEELYEPSYITAARELSDGSIVLAGSFHSVDGWEVPHLCRLGPDGSLDLEHRARVLAHGAFFVQALQHDGAALVLWYRTGYLPERIARLRPDGSLDTDFVLETGDAGPDVLPKGMAELPDGTLVNLYGPLQRWRADGSRLHVVNEAEGTTIHAVAQAATGDWIIGGGFGARRLRALATPGILIAPVAQSVAMGARAWFSVEIGDAGPTSFQWQRDGVDIPRATRPMLTLAAVSRSDAGVYRVVIRAGASTYVSDGVALTVRPSTAHLVNFSARSRLPAGGPPQIAGFVTAGETPRRVLLRGIGLNLDGWSRVGTRLIDPAIGLFEGEHLLAHNACGARSPEMLAVAAEVGAFDPRDWEIVPGLFVNYDSALVCNIAGGIYTLHTSSPSRASGISLAEFYDAGEGAAPGFVRNLSLRGRTGPGVDTMIGGFIVSGEGALRLLVRVVGGELSRFGVGEVLDDPRLRLYRGASPIAVNDTWEARPAAELAELVTTSRAVGAFPLTAGSGSAAILIDLLPGTYTVHAESVSGAVGEVLLEVYVVDPEE